MDTHVHRKEQEAFNLVVERHLSGASENDIRTPFQRFAESVGVAAPAEMAIEVPPGIGNAGRMDQCVQNTCIEFKRDILRASAIAPDYVAQLDGYLKQLVRAGNRGTERHPHRWRELPDTPTR